MTPTTTTERLAVEEPVALFTMLEKPSFVASLVGELRLAVKEFTHNPQGFIREIFSDEKKDTQRRNRIRAGLVLALVAHTVIGGFLIILSRHTAAIEKKRGEPELEVKILQFPPTKVREPEIPLSAVKPTTTLPPVPVMPRGQLDNGGGGGGQNSTQEQPKAGQPPQTVPIPSIVATDSQPMPNPSMPVPGTLEGPESNPPAPDPTIGSNGKNPNAGGEKGRGNGTGGGDGTGNGPGKGSGTGPGENGRTGGGTFGTPDGVSGPINYGDMTRFPDRTNIVFTYRVRPIVTREAQENKIYGYVLLEATFNADGTITDIVVRQHLPNMDDEAVEAVKRIKFRPATIKGVPVTLRRVPIKVPVNLEAR